MSKRALTLAAVTTLLAACSGSGPTGPTTRDLAPSFARMAPGVPRTPNCRGQTIAFAAQVGKIDPEFAGVHGIGGLARFVELSVQELHAAVELFCAGPING
jgi:hypothetical protein